MQWIQDTVEKNAAESDAGEEDDSDISEFDVFDETNNMEEGYRSVHGDDSRDDNARSEGSEEEGNDDSNEQGTDYSITVNAVHTRLILFT